jgi:hypothetical protein
MPTHPLHALAHGDLVPWRGVPPGAGVEWARDGLGPDVVDDQYLLVWRGGATGPDGIEIWLGDTRQVELVQMPLPRLTPAAMEPLGTPELELASNWSRGARQFAWPSHGLAVHASLTAVVRIVGFAVMDADTFSSHRFATMGRPPRR